MVTYVLDASAVLRLPDREAGCDRLDQIIDEHANQSATAIIAAIQWREVIGIPQKRIRAGTSPAALSLVRALNLAVIPIDALRAENASALKAAFGLS